MHACVCVRECFHACMHACTCPYPYVARIQHAARRAELSRRHLDVELTHSDVERERQTLSLHQSEQVDGGVTEQDSICQGGNTLQPCGDAGCDVATDAARHKLLEGQHGLDLKHRHSMTSKL